MVYYNHSRSALAYAERAIPKLRLELSSEVLITRQKAIKSMSDLMHSTEKVHEAVNAGCFQQLIHLLHDTDETVRFLSVSVVQNMVQNTVGRKAFMATSEGLPNLLTLFNDKSFKIQLKAFEALDEICNVREFAKVINDKGLKKLLVEEHLIKTANINDNDNENSNSSESASDVRETDTKLLVILKFLEILQKLLFVNQSIFNFDRTKVAEDLESKTIIDENFLFLEALKNLILKNNLDPKLKSEACLTIHNLCCTSPSAKKSASEDCKLLSALVKLLNFKESQEVRSSSSQALMTICITTKGKLTAFKEGICERLIYLIDEAIKCSEAVIGCCNLENDALRLNVIRLVEIVSEVPAARKFFNVKERVGKIGKLEGNLKLSSDVRRAAGECIRVIEWVP